MPPHSSCSMSTWTIELPSKPVDAGNIAEQDKIRLREQSDKMLADLAPYWPTPRPTNSARVDPPVRPWVTCVMVHSSRAPVSQFSTVALGSGTGVTPSTLSRSRIPDHQDRSGTRTHPRVQQIPCHCFDSYINISITFETNATCNVSNVTGSIRVVGTFEFSLAYTSLAASACTIRQCRAEKKDHHGEACFVAERVRMLESAVSAVSSAVSRVCR